MIHLIFTQNREKEPLLTCFSLWEAHLDVLARLRWELWTTIRFIGSVDLDLQTIDQIKHVQLRSFLLHLLFLSVVVLVVMVVVVVTLLVTVCWSLRVRVASRWQHCG